MKNHYFYCNYPQGTVYIKTTYYTPINNLSHEALIICVYSNGVIQQSIQNWSESQLQFQSSKLLRLSEEEFVKIQEEKLFNCSRQQMYESFFNSWKDYYSSKREAINIAKEKAQNDFFNYGKMLESQYKELEVFSKRDSLLKVENGLYMQNNPSLMQIFEEARDKATEEFLKGN